MSLVFFFSPGGPLSTISIMYFLFPHQQDCQVLDSKDHALNFFFVLHSSERMRIIGQLPVVSIAMQVALCG